MATVHFVLEDKKVQDKNHAKYKALLEKESTVKISKTLLPWRI